MTGQVYVEGFGCPSNDYDLKIILSRFESKGYVKVASPVEADVVVVNTCAVRKRTEDRILSRLRYFENLGRPVVVAGCLSAVNPEAVVKALPSYTALLSPSSVERIEEVLNQKFQLRGQNLLGGSNEPKVGTASSAEGSLIEVVPISEGCLGECAFCCTRMARGRLISADQDSIVKTVKLGLGHGTKEFWLTGQDVGPYGRDICSNLPELLHDICSIDDEFRIRVGMLNPEWVLEYLDELTEAYRDPKVFKFLHIPLQSGDDEVLQTMKRRYAVGDFLRIVKGFRRKIPKITLWTDIICGYPTEDEKAFADTLNVLRNVQPDNVNVSKFSSRPGTAAQRLSPLPSEIVKERSRRASSLCSSISLSRNRRWIGWIGTVLVDEEGTGGKWISRTDTYKPVTVTGPTELYGQRISVKVVDAMSTHLVGQSTGP